MADILTNPTTPPESVDSGAQGTPTTEMSGWSTQEEDRQNLLSAFTENPGTGTTETPAASEAAVIQEIVDSAGGQEKVEASPETPKAAPQEAAPQEDDLRSQVANLTNLVHQLTDVLLKSNQPPTPEPTTTPPTPQPYELDPQALALTQAQREIPAAPEFLQRKYANALSAIHNWGRLLGTSQDEAAKQNISLAQAELQRISYEAQREAKYAALEREIAELKGKPAREKQIEETKAFMTANLTPDAVVQAGWPKVGQVMRAGRLTHDKLFKGIDFGDLVKPDNTIDYSILEERLSLLEDAFSDFEVQPTNPQKAPQVVSNTTQPNNQDPQISVKNPGAIGIPNQSLGVQDSSQRWYSEDEHRKMLVQELSR